MPTWITSQVHANQRNSRNFNDFVRGDHSCVARPSRCSTLPWVFFGGEMTRNSPTYSDLQRETSQTAWISGSCEGIQAFALHAEIPRRRASGLSRRARRVWYNTYKTAAAMFSFAFVLNPYYWLGLVWGLEPLVLKPSNLPTTGLHGRKLKGARERGTFISITARALRLRCCLLFAGSRESMGQVKTYMVLTFPVGLAPLRRSHVLGTCWVCCFASFLCVKRYCGRMPQPG